ncbi:hypothetical protein [Pseudothermotoga thermarum]|uniref:Uncharacterized protein n=1 Tax=Pseudothermotoga thermarum DSM 5069 TaxID=688269 RepID=F7YUT8_9THEM|nr:hypothetical protein [Pseudothermotoga thermarum]AEH51498.1 hypothetical protein Theth_1441 [Pseudothermotoga thermarum DSM 5069]
MWFKDEKMMRNLKINCWFLWTATVVITMILFFGTQSETNLLDRFLPFVVLVPIVTISTVVTFQYKNYSQGIFLSDYEIILPGIKQHRIEAPKLKKIVVVDQRTKSGRQFLLKFYVQERSFPYSVTFSSDSVRREILTMMKDFLKELTIEDKTIKKKGQPT